MKLWHRFLLGGLLCFLTVAKTAAQQQPVMTVAIESVFADGRLQAPNEAYGPARQMIQVEARAVGTHLVSSFTYSFFVNGVSIGETTGPVVPPDTAVVPWTPPQPGSYFITVTADDGTNTATSLPVRFFATGTVVNSPMDGTIVPAGSSVVLKADATVGRGFIKEIQFYDNGSAIGIPDRTYPYSLIYTPPGSAGVAHSITARATDNNGQLLPASAVVSLSTVTPITPLPTCSISYPTNASTVLIPPADKPLTVQVNAGSPTGFINKVELYVDGVLFGTSNRFPYTFSWGPGVVGNYTLTALAYDDKNNVIASPTNTVLIAAPLTVAVTSPLQGGTVTGGSPTQIRAVATDSNTDAAGNPLQVVSVQFFVDAVFVGQATTPSSPNTYTTTATLTPKRDPDGNLEPSVITALATDTAGISGVSPGISVIVTEGGSGGGVVVGEPPTVAVTWPMSGIQVPVNRPLFMTAAANDTDGNIVSVQFFANNLGVGTSTVYPYSTTWTPTSLGTYALAATTIDSDGNAVTSPLVRITVVDPAPNPPSIAINTPANGATITIGAQQTIKATASDDVSVASVQFFVDGMPLGGADTAYPFEQPWKPVNPGLYTLTARVANVSGNQTTSAPVLVFASAEASDAVFSGSYQALGEAGSFALVAAPGRTGALIGHSTGLGAKQAYFYSDISVDSAGNLNLLAPTGGSLVSGTTGETGAGGNFDGARLTFIGLNTKYLGNGTTAPTGYFSGRLTAKPASTLAAIVGPDGSITLYAADGTFVDAGSGRVDASGAFNVSSIRGARFTGRVDPSTRLLTGTLSGTGGGDFSGAIVSLSTANEKITGTAAEVGSNIFVAANGKTYDQVLLRGPNASVTADPGQITRVSYLDLTGDLVQVEFSGAGRLAISLSNPSGPMIAANYNQPGISYMKGHASLVITGANETTNVSVFSVGRITAANQALFRSDVVYDGVADIGYMAILSTNGKFGGVRTANANYLASSGMAGICAPGVEFTGPVYVGDINASDTAEPVLLLGASTDVRVTGGDLWQSNERAVRVSGITRLAFTTGTTSHNVLLPAQTDRSRLEQDGRDVTIQLVVNPTP